MGAKVMAIAGAIVIFSAIVLKDIQIEDGLLERNVFIKIYFQSMLNMWKYHMKQYLGYGHYTAIWRQDVLDNYTPLEAPPGVKVYTANFSNVAVRIYERENRQDRSAALVWIHGGGFIVFFPEIDDRKNFELLKSLDILIISIEYRLAPEHPYPAAFDDCYAAFNHFMEELDAWNVDRNRVAVGGESAGGALAAAVVLKARDQARPVKLQVLIVPMLQATDFNTPSYQQNKGSMILSRRQALDFWLFYAKGIELTKYRNKFIKNEHISVSMKAQVKSLLNHSLVADQYRGTAVYKNPGSSQADESLWESVRDVLMDPYFAPLMASDLTGLPQTYLVTAQFDVLRDDGIIYGERLRQSGGRVTHHHYQGAVHPVLFLYPATETSHDAMRKYVTFLKQNL